MKKAFLTATLALLFCVVLPIWYYLLYQILVRVDASDLMWFLYWVYVPAVIVLQIVQDAFKRAKND